MSKCETFKAMKTKDFVFETRSKETAGKAAPGAGESKTPQRARTKGY